MVHSSASLHWHFGVNHYSGAMVFKPAKQNAQGIIAVAYGEKTQLDQEYPKEIAPVVSDLNALVFHYQELLERARHHAGNLSHALKTPLSVLKNDISTKDSATQEQLRPPIDQIQNQIDYHLGRARMAGAKNILSVSANPSERVDAISMAFDKVYTERGISLINELDSSISVAVEKTDLDEMLGNLIENAYKWSSSIIRVHSLLQKDSPETIDIMIEDDGIGIPEQKLGTVIKRGVRLDETILWDRFRSQYCLRNGTQLSRQINARSKWSRGIKSHSIYEARSVDHVQSNFTANQCSTMLTEFY